MIRIRRRRTNLNGQDRVPDTGDAFL